jgi:aryl-alcohol dehydrogenase-like predicted oxidoreductase
VIPKIPFGKTGQVSTRILFGAAALWGMKQEKADRILEMLLTYEVNHIDVAAGYGDAELRIGAWMKQHRRDFFLATKTGGRTYAEARDSIQRSLERLQVDQIDLIQFHNLTDETDWETVFGPDGALMAALEARDKGWVRFIGVTGHGTRAPEMHLRSLERFPFDSVLVPYNFMLLQNAEYAADIERLMEVCHERGVAVQTIKAVARRRWREGDPAKRFSWYEPIKDPEILRRAVHFVLSRPGIFLNTSSDATLLPLILKAASELEAFEEKGSVLDLERQLKTDAESYEMAPIFLRGVMDTV